MEEKIKHKIELLLDFFGFDKNKVEIKIEQKPYWGFNIFITSSDAYVLKQLIGKKGHTAQLLRQLFLKLGKMNGININFYVLPNKELKT